MKNFRASFYALTGGILIGATLIFMSSQAHSATIHYRGNGYIIATPTGGGQAQTIRMPFQHDPNNGYKFGLTSPKAAEITNEYRVPVNGGKVPLTVPVTQKQVIPKAKVAAAVSKLAKGLIPGVVAGAILLDALELLGYECDLTGCRTIGSEGGTYPATQSANQTPHWKISTLYTNNGAFGQFPQSTHTIYQACAAAGPGWTYNGVGYCSQSGIYKASTSTSSTYTYSCPSGGTLSGTTCTTNAVPSQPVSEEQLIDNLPDAAIEPELKKILDNKPDEIDADEPQLSGPASVTSPSSTTTNFNSTTNTTTVTTNTTTATNNYSGNSYNYTITNNSSTTVNGVPSGTTSEEVVPKPEDTAVVTDTDMPPLPTLYERKYPDGIQGVWTTRSAEIKATPLFGLSAIFNPSIGGGSCPVWTFDANIGPHMNFGTGVISPPCWLWPMIKAVLIITALLISRRLVFGG